MATATPLAPARRSPLKRLARAVAVFVAVPYLGIIVLAAVFQRSLIYGPARDDTLNVRPENIFGARTEPIGIRAADNVLLSGWRLVADRAGSAGGREGPGGRPVVLYFCGNAGNRAYRADVFEIFAELGADTICFDYRGYGDNRGSPSEAAFAADASAIWRYVTRELSIDPRRIVVFGESLGGGMATRLAAEMSAAGTPPGGLVLRSTFTRLTDVAAWHFPWLPVRWLLLDRYASIDRIGKVACPCLILHGRRDTIVPFEQGARLFAAAPEFSSRGVAKRLVALETADHNDVLSTERNAFRLGIDEFLQHIR